MTKHLGHGMANFMLLPDHGKKGHFPKFAFLTDMNGKYVCLITHHKPFDLLYFLHFHFSSPPTFILVYHVAIVQEKNILILLANNNVCHWNTVLPNSHSVKC